MTSIWKDLLFLHSHLAHKEDLIWSSDVRTEADRDEADANKIKSAAVQCCVAVWPRLAGPR